MERTQRIRIYTYDGSMYRLNVKIHNIQNHKNEEQALKNEIKNYPHPSLETEEGIIHRKDIREIKFVDDNDGKIGFR